MKLITKNQYITDIKAVREAIINRNMDSLSAMVSMINQDIDDFNELKTSKMIPIENQLTFIKTFNPICDELHQLGFDIHSINK